VCVIDGCAIYMTNASRVSRVSRVRRVSRVSRAQISKKKDRNSVWTLAESEWRAAAPGLKPLRLPRAQHTTPTQVNRQTDKECAWGRPRLLETGFKMLFVRSFVTCHERATAGLFHVGARQYYCVSHLSSRRSDSGLTMQVSCFQDKPNMRAGAQEDTSEVVGRHRCIIRIYVQ